ncbi:MAG: hypothetical protein K1W01_08680 [Muribaculaceae bacterium]
MKPNIFICNEVAKHFDDGISTIQSLLAEIKEANELQLAIPFYLFAYCKYEGTLYQIYKHTFRAFPNRNSPNKLDIKPADIINCSCKATILDLFCISFSKKFGDGDISIYKGEYEKIVDTKIDLPASIVNSINEYKDYRNQLAHHGRIDNDNIISKEIMCSHLEAAIEILTRYKDSFLTKYKDYTEQSLIRSSCQYLFKMNTVLFDKCFYFDCNNVLQIHIEGLRHWYGTASSSEKHCFLLFIANFGDSVLKSIDSSCLRPRISLTDNTIEKISYIDELFKEYPYIINHL